MVKNCSVGGCKSRSSYVKDDILHFYTFPSHSRNKERRAQWARLCGRVNPKTEKDWAPRDDIRGVYVCSKHFVTGKPCNEPTHPDFLPSLFLPGSQQTDEGEAKKREIKLKRFKSQNRRSILSELNKLRQDNPTARGHCRDFNSLMVATAASPINQKAVVTPLADLDGASAPPPDLDGAPAPPPDLDGAPAPPPDLEGAPAPPPDLEGAPAPPPDLEGAPAPPPDLEGAPAPPPDLEGAPAPPSTQDAVATPPPTQDAAPAPPPTQDAAPATPPTLDVATAPSPDLDVADPMDASFQKDATIKALQRRLSKTEQQRNEAQAKNDYLTAKLNTVIFSSAVIYKDDHKSMLYTGLSWHMFMVLFNFLMQFVPSGGPATRLSNIDQFFLTLVRLRQNDIFEKLSDHAGIAKSTLSDYFWKWVQIMFIKCRFLIQWPDRDRIHKIIPPHFKVHFPKLTCIIDCFEIFIEAPTNLKARAQTYSTYKSHTTAKYLIGCNPLGAVIFLSKGFGGRASDLHIVRESGFISLDYHHPGDQILADRGFTFQKELAGVCGAHLHLPYFIKGKNQFTAEEVEISRKISSVRIHIERVIGLIKNRFAILQQTMPVRMVKSLTDEMAESEFSSLDKIVTCCAILVNLGPSIVYKEDK